MDSQKHTLMDTYFNYIKKGIDPESDGYNPRVAVDLSHWSEEVTDCDIYRMLRIIDGRHITSLNLTECDSVTDTGLEAIAAGYPALTSLNLTECDSVTDKGLEAIVSGCPALTSLDLTECDSVIDTGLEAIAAGCPNLDWF